MVGYPAYHLQNRENHSMNTKTKKRICAALLALVTLLLSAPAVSAETPAVWNGMTAESFAGGTGTQADPYRIETAEQLAYFAQAVAGGNDFAGEFIGLGADLLLNDTKGWKNWGLTAPENTWTAIGTYEHPFSGNFSGDGHTVGGIYIHSEESCQGLFGYAVNAVITGVGIECSLIVGAYDVGGVLGYNNAVGGASLISDCYNAGDVCGTEGCAGGVVGYSFASDGAVGTVKNCYNKGSVSGGTNIGGVLGCFYVVEATATVENCYSVGSVDGAGWIVGGVMSGIDANGGSVTLKNCFHAGSVCGGGYVGGVVGFCEAIGNGSTSVQDCFNAGSVGGGSFVGGVAGSQYSPSGTVTLKNCYSVGEVNGTDRVGGVAGSSESYEPEGVVGTAVVADCYYLSGSVKDGDGVAQYGIGAEVQGETVPDISGQTAELSDGQMQQQESFAGFDFGTVWTMDGNRRYFYPELQGLPMVIKETWVKGDVNGDKSVDAFDYQMLKAYVLGTFPEATDEQIARMRINDDTLIDAFDFQMLKAAVLGTYVLE